MTKCDFCTMCGPTGECFWDTQIARRGDCEKAIKRMMEAMKKDGKKKRRL